MRRARVVALQRTDTERAEAVERKVVRDPRSQFVALIRVQVTDRIVLRESLELRILLRAAGGNRSGVRRFTDDRSEEHTSEIQSPYDLVCRLLLENKN